MKALQYSEYGPSSVLRVVELAEPEPGPGRIRIAVRAVGINPFDWKVRSGAFGDTTPSRLPVVPHSDAAGVVDALGEGVEGVAIGDEVFGVAPSGGAAERAVLRVWTAKPAGMSFAEAAGLPNVVETAGRALALLGLDKPAAADANGGAGNGPGGTAGDGQGKGPGGGTEDGPRSGTGGSAGDGSGIGHGGSAGDGPGGNVGGGADGGAWKGRTLVVNGAAGGVGIAAVQLAVARGATVIGTASERNHEFVRGLGATPVTYGAGLADRVRAIVPGGVDFALDTAGRGAVAELVTLTPTPADVVSIADFDAPRLGARVTDGSEGRAWETLEEAAALYVAGRFTMPVERAFPLEEAAAAHDLSESGHVRGKVVLTL